jgi:ribosomal protein S18 acetylase RimI-like enzyme
LLRFGHGRSRRANSVWPMRAGVLPLDDKIAACERAYAAAGLPIVFRIPSITPDTGLDTALAAHGYVKADKTSIRLAALAGFAEPPALPVALEPASSAEWLATFARLDGMTPVTAAAHRAIVEATRHPTMFGSVRDGGAIVAVAAAVLQGRFVYFNSVATEPAQRRRGLARAVMAALLGWAREQGADYAYLPVVKTNVAGLALYGALGFEAESYRYHYRSKPA